MVSMIAISRNSILRARGVSVCLLHVFMATFSAHKFKYLISSVEVDEKITETCFVPG